MKIIENYLPLDHEPYLTLEICCLSMFHSIQKNDLKFKDNDLRFKDVEIQFCPFCGKLILYKELNRQELYDLVNKPK